METGPTKEGLVYTEAETALRERNIPREWVERNSNRTYTHNARPRGP